MLHRKHWEHHGATGRVGLDPDFHGGDARLLPWFGRFMREYSTVGQYARIVGTTVLLQAMRVPYANLCVYYAAAPILAAFRLFYFGTYLPHLPRDSSEAMPWEKSHSSGDPAWLSFFKVWCGGGCGGRCGRCFFCFVWALRVRVCARKKPHQAKS